MKDAAMWDKVEVKKKRRNFALELDGKPVNTPSGNPLVVPSEGLARAICEEFHAQKKKKLNKETMPLYGLACLALDVWSAEGAEQMEELMAYLQTELLCYRADSPQSLVEIQAKEWNPILSWVQQEWGVPFVVTAGVMPVPQAPEMEKIMRAFFKGWDHFRLTALQQATYQCGSIVAGYAMVVGRLTPAEALQVSHLDEFYQRAIWGEDVASTMRLEDSLQRLEDISRFAQMVNN